LITLLSPWLLDFGWVVWGLAVLVTLGMWGTSKQGEIGSYSERFGAIFAGVICAAVYFLPVWKGFAGLALISSVWIYYHVRLTRGDVHAEYAAIEERAASCRPTEEGAPQSQSGRPAG
jgi:hypothetical protein